MINATSPSFIHGFLPDIVLLLFFFLYFIFLFYYYFLLLLLLLSLLLLKYKKNFYCILYIELLNLLSNLFIYI